MTKSEFYAEAQRFLNLIDIDLESNKVTLAPHWDIDHLCFRADSQKSYQSLKQSFSSIGTLLIESEVNGRPISTFKLDSPVYYKNWRIDLVELPAPKEGVQTPLGFEHIEVVCDVPFSELISKYKNLDLNLKGLRKDFNQELEICFDQRKIKFHHLSLASVIQLEKNTQVWEALQSSKVLSHLKDFSPLIAGTFPLGLNVPDSDLDIILNSRELEKAEEILKTHFGGYRDFEIFHKHLDDSDTLICCFLFHDIPFELFVQKKDSVKQQAFRHFLVEERILKFGGEEIRKKIMHERLKGLKTEPAFAKVLKFEGDPFKFLNELQVKANQYIEKVIIK